MLLIHLFLNSGSVDSETSSFVYSEIMFTIISLFQNLIKGGTGGWNKSGGGLKIFSKINKRGGGTIIW